MPNPVAVNDLQPISGSLQTSRVSYGVETTGKNYGQDYNGTTWYSDIPNNGQFYTIISDNYTANYYVSRSNAEGAYVEGGLPAVDEYSAPVFWTTVGTSSLDIITIVNGLPDRIGQVPFNSGSQALNWVASSSNYFAVGPDYYAQIDADQMLFYVDANQVISYPTTQSTWYDLSGNSSNVSLQNTPSWDSNGWFSGDGVDDRFVIDPTSINYSRTALTVEAFVYYNATFSGYRGNVMSKWQTGAGSNNEWSLSSENASPVGTGPGLLGFALQYTSAGIQGINGTTVMIPQKWYHCVGTYDGSNLRIYVNGVLENTVAALASSYKEYAAQPTSLLGFGNGLVGGPDYYPTNARLSEARIYNKAISTSDVAQNYYGGPIVTDDLQLAVDAGNLVSYPKSGTTAYDLTSNSIDGTLLNGVAFSSEVGGTFVYDGVDDTTRFPNPFTNPNNFSIEFWANIDTSFLPAGPRGGLVSTWDASYIGFAIAATDSGGQRVIRSWANDGAGGGMNWGLLANYAGKWTHFVLTFEGNTQRGYLNGAKVAEETFGGGVTNVNNLYVGYGGNGSYLYTPMKSSTLRCYNRTLTLEEIQQNYNATK